MIEAPSTWPTWVSYTGKFCKNPYMEVDMGNIPFPIQTHKTHTWESCTNLINGILPLMVFNSYKTHT